MKKYISQNGGSCCFVVAAANCLIYHNKIVPDLEVAYDIAKCRHGNTISHQAVIDYLDAPLSPTKDYDAVLEKGGIFNIMHPIFNGHSIFVFPVEKGIRIVNSWLGPNIVTVGISEIRQFVPEHNNLGMHWIDNG